ncbi:MAG: CsgG/HfaB family protein [Bacteroidota bacterium]
MIRILTFLVIIILTCFFISCTPSTSALVYKNPKYASYQSAKVVILPFKDAEAQVGSGEIVSSMFEMDLRSMGKFEVIKRTQLDKILIEQKLSLSGLIEDPVSVGKLVKADVVVMGTVTTWKESDYFSGIPTTVGASIKGIHVETGITLWSIDKTSSTIFNYGLLYPTTQCTRIAKKLCEEMVNALIEK